MKTTNTMDVRLTNAQTILHELEIHDSITNSEIAKKHNLSIPTISNIVNLLKNDGMIISAVSKISTGGRKPALISLNPNYHYMIGINILKHVVYAVALDFCGQMLCSKKYYHDFEDSASYWNKIADIHQEILSALPSGVSVHTGISFPGTVHPEELLITGTSTLGVDSIQASGLIEALGCAVTLTDSARSAALAQIYGRESCPDSIYLLLSRRIAGAMIYQNNILQLSNSDCNFGSTVISDSQEASEYGIAGSFVSFCSSSLIIDTLKKKNLPCSFDYFFTEISNGDEFLKSIWDEYLAHLATALHNIYCIFGIAIIIGGEMAEYISLHVEELTAILEQKYQIPNAKELIHISTYGQYDDSIGAALYAHLDVLNEKLFDALRNS